MRAHLIIALIWGTGLAAPVLFGAEEVKLLSNINVPMSRYGIRWQNSQTKVLVKNLAYKKDVVVVFTGSEDETRVSAKYFGPANDGYEVWVAYSQLGEDNPYEFYVEYTVDGQIFKGDDKGQPFVLKNGPVLYNNQAIQQLNTGTEFFGNFATVTAALNSELGFHKTVKLHYSFDDFVSKNEVTFSFVPTYYYGYGLVESPTREGAEIWQSQIKNIPDGVETIRYYLTYEVGDKHYADTNFGKNYSMTRYRDPGSKE